MGTLIANEDAFAREMLGLPTLAAAQQQQQQQAAAPAVPAAQQPAILDSEAKPPLLLLDNKPASEPPQQAAATLLVDKPISEPAPNAQLPPLLLAAGGAGVGASAPPLLAGEAELAEPAGGLPGAALFSMLLQSGKVPRGPPDFLRRAFDRPEPLPRIGEALPGDRTAASLAGQAVCHTQRVSSLPVCHILSEPS
jgi:hypothetical protein